MRYKYQNITLKSFSEQKKNSDTNYITLVDNEKKCKSHKFSTSLEKNILQSLSDKKNKVFVELSDCKNYILVVSKNEKEALRKLGAELYKKIKNENDSILIIKNIFIFRRKYVRIIRRYTTKQL